MHPEFVITALLLGVMTVASGADQPSFEHDPLLALPVPPKADWVTAPELAFGDQVVPGVRMLRAAGNSRVVLDGVLNMDKGPTDGLEVLACLKDGKTHESLFRIEETSGKFIKFACIAALGLSDGMPPAENSGLPARGTPVRVRALWQDEDGTHKIIDASCLVRDRAMDKAFPPLPFIYTGSRMLQVQEAGPDGQVRVREHFMLDNTKSVIVNYDEPDTLLASPFPGAGWNTHRFEANSRLTPPVGAKVLLLLEHAELPLTLDEDDHGLLRASANANVLDDEGLQALLAAHFGSDLPTDDLRAVGVRVAKSVDRPVDVVVRTRLLAAAAAAKVWVVPVFELSGE